MIEPKILICLANRQTLTVRLVYTKSFTFYWRLRDELIHIERKSSRKGLAETAVTREHQPTGTRLTVAQDLSALRLNSQNSHYSVA